MCQISHSDEWHKNQDFSQIRRGNKNYGVSNFKMATIIKPGSISLPATREAQKTECPAKCENTGRSQAGLFVTESDGTFFLREKKIRKYPTIITAGNINCYYSLCQPPEGDVLFTSESPILADIWNTRLRNSIISLYYRQHPEHLKNVGHSRFHTGKCSVTSFIRINLLIYAIPCIIIWDRFKND